MTSHLVETVRDIPLSNDKQIPVDAENSGFPFDDRDFDRDRSHSSFRSQLDDIARRHPEFAEHLNISGGFPFRSHTLGRHPRRSSDAEKPSGSQDAEFRRYPHDRGFSRFNNFDFPFHKYFDEDVPDFYEADRQPLYTYTTHQQPAEEADFQQPQQSQPSSPQPTSSATAEKPPQVPQTREGARKQNIQQSNTVDLGQKQEPVDENRGQRSMSAPPENRSTGQRFVSSINIPIQRPGGGGDMGAKSSAQAQDPPQQQPQCNKPNERVIPIHVEGRNEPIIPKNTTFTQPSPQPQPQSERIFGRTPSHFTQYVNRGEPHGMNPEEHYKQQQQFQKQQQQNFKQQQNQNTPQEPQAQSQQAQSQQAQSQQAQSQQAQSQQAESQPAPPPQTPTQLHQIQNIQKDVNELMNQVEKFNGKPRNKEYLYLDEMLTRNLIKLDTIETEGKDNIRQARKEAIKCIEGCIGILEAKANANLAAEKQREEKMDVAQAGEVEKPEEQPPVQVEPSEESTEPSKSSTTNEEAAAEKSVPTTLEVSGVVRSGSVANVTPMEVTTIDESNKDVPVPAQMETQTQEKKEEITLSADSQQKSDQKAADTTKEEVENEKKEDKEKEDIKVKDEVEKDDSTNPESPKVTETTNTTTEAVSENTSKEATSEDKKEKKKGKKKEKTDKK
ncbi:hypothetical protein AMK59_3611 [Oryctes borbonicus]|uniref:BAG domain-containing protein n=1 Tax=Oryctes borbonicus TaxID=1629725 RepID=A0A0T6B8Z0_9SCAR|nr:hypothetical protein AMK59_3611 [Oryctes borbonicus]